MLWILCHLLYNYSLVVKCSKGLFIGIGIAGRPFLTGGHRSRPRWVVGAAMPKELSTSTVHIGHSQLQPHARHSARHGVVLRLGEVPGK